MGLLLGLFITFTTLRLAVSQAALLSTGIKSSDVSGRPISSPLTPTWSFGWATGYAVTGSGQGTASGSLEPTVSTMSSGGQSTSSGSAGISTTPVSGPSTTRSASVSSTSSGFSLTSMTNPGSTATSTSGGTGGSSPPPSATSLSSLATTLAALPSITLPASGISSVPSGTTASSYGVIFGGLLSSLSANIQGVDLTIPTIKAQVMEDVENTINQAEDLFDDLGGTDVSNSCPGASKLKSRSSPFTGLEKLAGDVTKIIGCADDVLNSLKTNLERDTPDPGLNEDLLKDLGTLADGTKPDDQPSGSASQSTGSKTDSATSDPSSTSSASSSAPSSSQASSTFVGCTGCCPTDIPTLPTSGTPAVTAAPTGFFDPLDKRSIPERFQQLAKRKPDVPIPKINNCNLKTPNNWPVTTPAYPGGYEFYTSDTKGVLGTLTTISRYYRSTTFGAPACTPTITQIDANQWTFQQRGPNIPENDKVSVDHAYELGFLKSFMESIIDKQNGLTCADANAQLFDTGSTCEDNRLQPIFGSLPSYTNPDFIAMSQWLNGDAKGWVLGPTFDPNLGGALLPGSKVRPFDSFEDATKKVSRKMSLAQILVEAALIINADNTMALMQKTNNRIYAAFKAHDTFLSQHAGLPRSNFGWANKYKTYMDNYVRPRNGASARLLPDLLTNIGSDLTTLKNIVRGQAQQATWDQWNNLHNSISTYYGSEGNGAGELNWSIDWEWDSNSVKRDEIEGVLEGRHVEKRQACSRPTSPSGSTGPTTTEPGTTQPLTNSASVTPSPTASSIPSATVSSDSTPTSTPPTSTFSETSVSPTTTEPPSTTEPPTTTEAPSTSHPMVTYPCSTINNQFGAQCKCGPFGYGQSPCPPSTVVAGPSVPASWYP